MAEDENDKTHVLMLDCIISELGRCEAGHMLSATDVTEGTWNWLQQREFLKSVADIEREADAEPVVDEPQHPNAAKSRAGKKAVPAEK